MDNIGPSFALGVFLGNAVICPLLGLKSWKDGFCIGLLAAIIVLVVYAAFGKSST